MRVPPVSRDVVFRVAADVRTLVVLALVAIFAAYFLLANGGSGGSRLEPRGFAISPEGEDVARLTPIKVTFKRPPAERGGAALLSLEPPTAGDYIWQSERTLIFQPAFPGLLRGQEYQVHVSVQPDAGLSKPVTKRFVTGDALAVESVIPAPDDVEVPARAQVLVQFNRSVAPLTQLDARGDSQVLFFDPPLAGAGEWLNTSLYRFIPEAAAVAPNTRYTVKVTKDLSSAADGVLKEDYVWSFTTFSPALEAITPDANTKFAAPSQQVAMKFNQPMERSSVEDAFRLRGPDGLTVAGSFEWLDEDARVIFSPSGSLAPLARYDVVLPKGLKGARGGETRNDWQSSFQTVGLPQVIETRPADGATNAERYGISVRFSNPMDEDSIEGRVSISGTDQSKVQTYLSPDQLSLSVYTPLTASTRYTVALADGIVDRYGQPLGPFSFSFATGARPPSITFAIPSEIATYSASAEPILYFHAINSRTATFTLYPLTDQEAARLQSLNYIPHQPGDSFQPSQPAIAFWSEDVSGDLNEVVLKSTSLSGDGRPLPRGNYYVKSNGQYRSDLVFSVVDTGLITKLSYDSLLVWAIDLDSGQPVAGVRLQASGGPLTGPDVAVTDANGVATFGTPSLVGQSPREDRRYLVRLDDAGRFGVTSTQWQQGAYTYDLGLPIEYYPKSYVGHLYTERPIYRPGEEVFYKGVVRRDDDVDYEVPTDTSSVFLLIQNSEGKELRREAISVNEFGSFAGSLVLDASASTGDYGVQLVWQPSPQYWLPVAGTSFMVAEFRTPEFEVSVDAPKPSYVSGETIDARVEARFFFGGALEGGGVRWSASASPMSVRFPGFERFSFTDYDYFRTQVSRTAVRAGGSAVTDNRGEAAITLQALISGNEGPQEYTLSATVTDQNAQAVAGSTTVKVHPAALYAGIRPAQYLARTGREARADVVVVDLDGKPVANRSVSVGVYERTWITTKERTPEGARRYKSEPRDTLVTTLATTTDAEGRGSVAFTPANAGTIRLLAEVRDNAGRVNRAAAYLWVTGESYASWQISNNDSLKLIADRDEYHVGDVAEVLVPAPFAGATGLVTVERGKVHDHDVQSFPTNSEVIRIPITDHSIPDVFVSVILYRPPTAEDPVPRYKVGYVELKVSTETRLLNVTIQPDRDQAKPGDSVRYDVQVTDAAGLGVKAELSVAVVDKAVLSLAEERGINGLHAFWFERGLGVKTASSLAVSINRSNDVISEAALGGKGGGGLSDDRIRQDFRNTAYWEAQLVTGDDGHASVEVVMPDNLTTWRMQVRAISGDILVGEATNELLSTQPLLLRPSLPRFLRVGDYALVRLLVRNATAQEEAVTVSLQAEGVDLLEAGDRSVDIPARQSVLLEWPANVSNEGTARISFTARSRSGLSDAVVKELPVYLDVTPETTATGGVVTDKPREESVYLPPYAVLDRGSLTVSVQASLTKSLAGELEYFKPYPSEGSALKAGRIIATLGVMRAQPDRSQHLLFSKQMLESDVAALVALQLGDGGWPWCRTCPSDPRITAWVLMALGEWRSEGNAIDGAVLDRASGYVQSYINRITDVARPADVNEKAFLLYAISIAGRANENVSTMRALFEQSRARLTNAGRAYLLLGMAEAGLTKKDKAVGQLLNDLATDVLPSANGNHWEDPYVPGSLQSGPRTTALVLDALVRLDPGHPLIEETVRWLDVGLRTNVCRTGLERAQAILSLSEFAAATGELGANYRYAVQLDGDDVMSGRLLSGEGTGLEQRKLPLTQLGVGTSIVSLGRDASTRGRMYYTLDLRYVTPATQIDALNRGIAVSREYSPLDAPQERITSARLGDVVRVKLTVMAPSERNYLVLEDFLPAGLEAIDPNLRITDSRLKAQLEEERRQANRPANLDYLAPWFGWYYNPWQHVDLRDDRVVISAQTLPKGVFEFVYYARATTPGNFYVAPAHAEESFFPEVFGRSDSARFLVEP